MSSLMPLTTPSPIDSDDLDAMDRVDDDIPPAERWESITHHAEYGASMH